MIQVEFIVKGVVQGVFFRKYTLERALSLNLRGNVYNADDLSVRGVAVGEREQINEFKRFLELEGSPGSVIREAHFEEKEVSETKFGTFEIIR
jgi:acylphosphatase